MFGTSKKSSSQPSPFQALILEPILTPSTLVDGIGEESPDIDDFDFDVDTLPDDFELGDVVDDAGIDLDEFTVLDYSRTLETDYTTGVFTVGENGEVGIDFLFDDGVYQGEVAIFSLEGMEKLEPGSNEFIRLAAERALSDSELGHVVISDITDGARFSESGGGFNHGDYQGVQTFKMRAGDEFGVMLAANHSIEDVYAGQVSGVRFSMATANPDDNLQFGQIADVTGDGNTFAFEDLSFDRSDRDYNDIIFQVRGAEGEAPLMDEMVAEGKDWRSGEMGQALIEYTTDVMEEIELENQARQTFVGIIDTGFAADNPDLDYDNIQLGSDFVDGDANPLLDGAEGNEHGTHIAGIIGGIQNNGVGIDGINDDAPLWFGRAVGSGQWSDSLREFVDAAKASGQPNAVVNLSLDLTQIDAHGEVTTRYEFTPEERGAIEYARQNGVLLVVAAGNDGGVMSVLGQASQEFDNIITVGAADGLDRADYSSFGMGLDLLAQGGTAENPVTSLVDDGIGTMAGTSVATAQVTGAVSQVWAANPELSYRQVIAILKQTATDLATPGWDAETGAGLVNLAAAIQVARETQGEVYDPEDFATPTTWEGAGKVTAQERAVNTKSISSYGRKIYNGYLYSGNEEDVLRFTANSGNRVLQMSINKSSQASVKVYRDGSYVGRATQDLHNSSRDYFELPLRSGSRYEVRIEEGSSSGKSYDLIMNFDGQSTGGTNGNITVSEQPTSSGGSSRPPKGDNNTNNSRSNAYDLGVIDTNRTIDHEWVGDLDKEDYFKFRVNHKTRMDIGLDRLDKDADLRLYDANGQTIESSSNSGSRDESINRILDPGTYYVRVDRNDLGDNTSYRLRLGAMPVQPPTPILQTGFDGSTVHPTYVNAYGRANGALGSPKDNVHPVGAGYMQHFLGGSEERGAIMKSNLNDNSYWVAGDFWSAFSAVGGAAGIMSYPTSDRYSVSGGQKQDFLGGVILKSSRGTFPVFGAMLGQYQKEGGERGRLGFPVSGEIGQGNGVIKQNFENGYILWNGKKATTYITQKTAPIAPRPTPTPNLLTSGNWGTLYGRHTSQIYTGSQNRAGLFDFKIGSALGSSQRLVQFALVDQGGENIPLSQAEIEIVDRWGNLVNLSQAWNPVAGSVPGKTTLPAGDYKVRVKPKQNLNYQVVMNLDTVGTVNLGTLKDIKSSGDYTIPQYVGSGDQIDRYTFRVERDTLTHLALKPPAGDTGANMYYAHMKLLNSSGRDVMLENPRKSKSENYATAWLKAGETYTMEVSREVNQGTNYELVINPDYSQQLEPEPQPIPITYPANFAEALAFVRRSEGGYSNHPNDRGGATNKGITQKTYNSYLANKGLPSKDVLWITDEEVNDIYYTMYWLESGSDHMTSRLALVHFDTYVNMGPGNANPILQQARQSSNQDEMSIVRKYLDLRETRYREIVKADTSQNVFLEGWLNRVNALRTEVEKEQDFQETPSDTEDVQDESFINEKTNWKTEVFEWLGNASKPPNNRADIRDGGSLKLIGEIDLGANSRFSDPNRHEKGLAIEQDQEPHNGNIKNHKGQIVDLPKDRFVIKSYTQANFTQGVEYEFMARGDDGYQIWAKHLETGTWEPVTNKNNPHEWHHNHGVDKNEGRYPFTPEKSGEYYIVNYYYENEGHAGFGMNWKSPRFDELRAKERLATQEIKEFRSLIEQQVTEPQQKGDLYEELQGKVEYRSQRDNQATALAAHANQVSYILEGGRVETPSGEMCGVTSLAMALSYLGVTLDDYPEYIEYKNMQFEDALYEIGYEEISTFNMYNLGSRRDLAAKFGVTSSPQPRLGEIKERLRQGEAITMSIANHIVRVEGVTDEGLVVDDPYARSKPRQNDTKWKQIEWQSKNTDVKPNEGENVLWKWSDLELSGVNWIAAYRKD